ncbi:MAG: hypothetical protein EA412_09600 [Chitinophagaceae bacterium]|nr:MAG: hypothetical protein EA412_09600 [Chitinophagaceae bacterium]
MTLRSILIYFLSLLIFQLKANPPDDVIQTISSAEITHTGFSSEKNFLTIGNAEGYVFLYDAAEYKLTRVLKPFETGLTSVFYNEREKTLVSISNENNIFIRKDDGTQHTIEAENDFKAGMKMVFFKNKLYFFSNNRLHRLDVEGDLSIIEFEKEIISVKPFNRNLLAVFSKNGAFLYNPEKNETSDFKSFDEIENGFQVFQIRNRRYFVVDENGKIYRVRCRNFREREEFQSGVLSWPVNNGKKWVSVFSSGEVKVLSGDEETIWFNMFHSGERSLKLHFENNIMMGGTQNGRVFIWNIHNLEL